MRSASPLGVGEPITTSAATYEGVIGVGELELVCLHSPFVSSPASRAIVTNLSLRHPVNANMARS
jgi:hypothetical protein